MLAPTTTFYPLFSLSFVKCVRRLCISHSSLGKASLSVSEEAREQKESSDLIAFEVPLLDISYNALLSTQQ